MAKAQHSKGSAQSSRTASRPETLWVRHRRDLWVLALVVVGAFLGLAELGALGPVGRALETALSSLIGVSRWILAAMLIALSAALLWGKVEVEKLRLVLGVGFGLVAVSGFAHLANGEPGFHATSKALGKAGGYLGVTIAGGLRHVIGIPGTLVVLVALVVVSAMFLTGVTLGRLLTTSWSSTKGAVIWLAEWWKARPEPAPAVRVRRDEEPEYEAASFAEDEAATFEAADDDVDESDGDDVIHGEVDNDLAEEIPPPAPPRRRRATTPAVQHGTWTLPSLDLLQRVKEQRHDRSAIDAAGDELVDALAAHGVETTLVGYTVGPTVTRFELELGPGVKVARVTSLHRDIAYAMASPDVRILAPIPGRSAIGVEVPNRQRTLVALGDLLATEESQAATHPLDVPLGRDIAGRTVVVNLAEMPHVLISGATGSGKSSCINSLITGLVMRDTPDRLRLILIDPKRVELGQYNDLPHLLSEVVVDPKKAAGALAWAVREMERRYDILAQYQVRDIVSYQAMLERGELPVAPTTAEIVANVMGREPDEESERSTPEALPYIVIVVDELNDLMMVAARDVEDSVVRIAQMARAVGIHLVLATQRPSVDVITGVIKANIPSRMAFAVSSLADSRVILDQAGAERLIGKGDVLLLTASSNVARRLQCPWVSEEEVRRVVSHWRAQGGVRESVVAVEETGPGTTGFGMAADDDDEVVLAQARELVIRMQSGSTSMLQRKLRVGFARAGRLMDQLEQEHVVGPAEGSKSRKVLVSLDEYERHQSAS